ncbi:MAG: UbiA family prenyltransferase [Candidatus Micrarchaeota archaeon]|nr:UbiA family prenyltransferase [Candidatus Micrarchaeota archaeon]
MDKITALLRLTRIEHSIMLIIAVIAAEVISGYVPALPVFALSIITPMFISMGSFAINDYFDVESDKANKRLDRPIVNGSIGKKEAYAVAMSCFAVGVLASIFINAAVFLIALAFAALAYMYSYKLKDMLLLGNVYIAFTMVIPFIYGNYVVSAGLGTDIILISIVIFLAGLAREIHGMVRDYQGDKAARKSKNLLYHVGSKRASQLAFVLYIEAVLVSIYMFFFAPPFAYNAVYIIPIAITDFILVYVSYAYLTRKSSRKFFSFTRNASLGAMALALIAFLAAAIVFIQI